MTLGLLTKDSSRADHTVGQRRLESRWRGCWPVAECVGAILVLSVVLTYASPPDPLWIPGIYDDHDYDDVVGMVTDGTGLGDSRVPQVVESALVDSRLASRHQGGSRAQHDIDRQSAARRASRVMPLSISC